MATKRHTPALRSGQATPPTARPHAIARLPAAPPHAGSRFGGLLPHVVGSQPCDSTEPSWRPAPASLRFADPRVEREFADEYREKSVIPVRFGLLLAVFLYAIFGILDTQIIPEARRAAWLIRYGIVCPLSATALLLTFPASFRWAIPLMSVVTPLVAGAGIILMIILAAPPGRYLYYAGLMMVCTYVYTFLRLRFQTATITSWSIVALYEVTALWIGDTAPAILLNNTFFLVGTNVLGMSACYWMERYARTDFLQRRIIVERNAALDHALIAVDQARQAAEEQSRLDYLTNLYNRRHFFSIAEHEVARAARQSTPLSVIMLDIDHFKRINDTYGHLVGDEVLQAVAARIRGFIRDSDVLCRYGGEEFVLLLPDADAATARAVAERVRLAVANTPVASSHGPIHLTVSLGYTSVRPQPPTNLEDLVAQADAALYAAKGAGRNRIMASAA